MAGVPPPPQVIEGCETAGDGAALKTNLNNVTFVLNEGHQLPQGLNSIAYVIHLPVDSISGELLTEEALNNIQIVEHKHVPENAIQAITIAPQPLDLKPILQHTSMDILSAMEPEPLTTQLPNSTSEQFLETGPINQDHVPQQEGEKVEQQCDVSFVQVKHESECAESPVYIDPNDKIEITSALVAATTREVTSCLPPPRLDENGPVTSVGQPSHSLPEPLFTEGFPKSKSVKAYGKATKGQGKPLATTPSEAIEVLSLGAEVQVTTPERITLRKRRRKLILDTQKQIPNSEFKKQLQNSRDTIAQARNHAPATRQAMKYMEFGAVNQMFSIPGRKLQNRSLFRLYSKNLAMSSGSEESACSNANVVPFLDADLNIPAACPPPEDTAGNLSELDNGFNLNEGKMIIHLGRVPKSGTSFEQILKRLNKPPPVLKAYQKQKPKRKFKTKRTQGEISVSDPHSASAGGTDDTPTVVKVEVETSTNNVSKTASISEDQDVKLFTLSILPD